MIRRFLNIILVTLSFFFMPVLYGQDFPKLHFTVSDGLPSNTVYYVYKDSRGFLWIATNKGLARYNGVKFEVFTTADGMADNEIFNIQEDYYGRIWLATYNGYLCYFKDNRFYTAKNTPYLKRPFKNTVIKKIIVEYDSSVTMIFANTSKMVNIGRDKLSLVYAQNDTDDKQFLYVNKIAKDCYKFIYQNFKRIVDTNHRELSKSLMNYSYGGKPCTDLDVSISQDQKYIFCKHFIFTPEMKLIKTLPEKPANYPVVKSYYFDNSNNMVCGTADGIYINDSIHMLPGSIVTSATQDLQGNLWVSTLNDGLYFINYTKSKSGFYNNAYTGEMWYAYVANGSLFYTNSDNNFYELKNYGPTVAFDYTRYKAAEYANNHAFLVFKDGGPNQYSYLNFYKNYIFYIQDITGERKLNVGLHPFNEAQIVKSIAEAKGQVYIRTRNRVYSIKTSHFKNLATLNVKNLLLADNPDIIRAYGRTPQNDIWFSSNFGVYKIINAQDSIQKQFDDITFNKFDFLGKYLIGYTLDGNMQLVCSNIDGVPVIDTIRQPGIWDMFYKIDSTHMLISTNDLYRLFTINPPGSRQPYSITVLENPFVPLKGDPQCAVAADRNFCYFFSKGSIMKLSTSDLFSKPRPPQLFFNFMRFGGRNYAMDKELKVDYSSQKNISISFSTLSFSGKNISYLYSVSKTEQDNFVVLKGENIDFIVPGYGKWIIKVKAKSMSSDYCEPIVYVLEIRPPFWATWWFNTICIVIATSLVVLGVRYRIQWVIRKSEKENENKIRFMKSEYKALNALMNPHFIFNTLNNVQGLVNRNDKLAANEYLRIFADLVRQNMHNVSKEMIPLQKEIDLVANYLALEKLRFKELMNYEIDLDDDVDTSLIMVPPLFIQPLVENSIKHGILPKQSENSRIIVKIFEVGDVVHIEVRDNGVGLSAAKKKANALHESFGLKNIQDRVEQLSMIMGKKIVFSIDEEMAEDGQWTVVSIKMQV